MIRNKYRHLQMLAQVFFVYCPGFYNTPASRNVSEARPHGPTLLTQSGGTYSKGIEANPSSSPPGLFVPATDLLGGEQTADACPPFAVQQQPPPGSHHGFKPPDRLMVCQHMETGTLRARGCPCAYCLLYYGNMEQLILPQYVTRFNWVKDNNPV